MKIARYRPTTYYSALSALEKAAKRLYEAENRARIHPEEKDEDLAIYDQLVRLGLRLSSQADRAEKRAHGKNVVRAQKLFGQSRS